MFVTAPSQVILHTLTPASPARIRAVFISSACITVLIQAAL